MNDQMVIINGVRVRRDEAAALGIKVPSAAATGPGPETAGNTGQAKKKPAARKARTPANKQRRTVENK